MKKGIVSLVGKTGMFFMTAILLMAYAGTAFSDCKNARCTENKGKLARMKQCVRCDLSFADLGGMNLNRANLEGANMSYANLKGADLGAANLKKTNLSYADLRGVNLRGANLTNAVLVAANLSGATWTDGLRCREGSVGFCKK